MFCRFVIVNEAKMYLEYYICQVVANVLKIGTLAVSAFHMFCRFVIVNEAKMYLEYYICQVVANVLKIGTSRHRKSFIVST